MSSIAIESLLVIMKSYVITLLWQVIFWPISSKLFANFPDRAWSVTRVFGVLITSFTLWTLANFGLRVNTDTGVISVMFFFLMLALWLSKRSAQDFFPKNIDLKMVVMAEYLFLSGFFLISFVRGYMPQLDSLEKFMDYGFVNSYLRTATLPAIDMWQAGSPINYYSFGHYWASVLIRTLGVEASIGYNLVLGFIGGSVASITLVLVSAISKHRPKMNIVGGLLASMAMIFGGNGHTVWYFLTNRSFDGYWYADATRFIHNTIHEFPAYSLIVSDLHGHLLDLPVVLFYLLVLTYVMKSRRIVDLMFMGFLFGVMMMTNTWDVLIYGLLTAVYYISLLLSKKLDMKVAVMHGLCVAITMFVVMGQWWIRFVPISSGVKLVTTRSPLWQLGVLWTIAILICLSGLVFKKYTKKIILVSVCLTVLMLILMPELIYFKDIYPDHPRANTMFKLTYQAFVMSVVIFGVVSSVAINKIKGGYLRLVAFVFVIFVFVSKMSFATLAYPSFYANFKDYRGLDGEKWLEEKSPFKYQVLNYLRLNDDKKSTLVEAVGDSYTEKNVISAYSGIPTIQGWRVHEWLWRGGYDVVAIRETEVREIYEGSDIEKTRQILSRYKVRWIVVGLEESENYELNSEKLLSLGEKIEFPDEGYIVLVSAF